jgi:hypothetical protein
MVGGRWGDGMFKRLISFFVLPSSFQVRRWEGRLSGLGRRLLSFTKMMCGDFGARGIFGDITFLGMGWDEMGSNLFNEVILLKIEKWMD